VLSLLTRFRILILAVVMLVTALLLATGCGASSSNQGGATSITFVADYNPAWIAQVPWNVAFEKGWYRDAGLEIDYKLPPSNADPPRLVGTGNADVTVSYTPDLLVAESKGLDVKALASLLDKNVEGIMTFDPSVHTPKDLEGKTVAIYDFPMAQINWRTFAQHYEIDTSKVNKVSEGDYGVPLILSGKADAIDAAAGGELADAELRKGEKAPFWVYQEKNGIPNFYWFVIAANGTFAKENPEATRKFVEVTMRALKWSEQHPEQAADIFAKRNPEATSKELARKGWPQMLDYSGGRFIEGKPAGYMDPAIWRDYAQFLEQQKFLTEPVDVDKLLTDNRFVPSS
jgi:putative hydroxymethylpyrimidine transport system substrate-binding protein